MHKMVMFTSDEAAVMLNRRNGVAVKLKERTYTTFSTTTLCCTSERFGHS